MRTSRVLAMATAAAITAALSLSGATSYAHERPPTHRTADRVLIVLFDQMLPQYADEFAMPTFRRLRGTGTDYNRAYLGMRGRSTRETFRTTDVMPTILKAMGIRPTTKMDGRAHSLGR